MTSDSLDILQLVWLIVSILIALLELYASIPP